MAGIKLDGVAAAGLILAPFILICFFVLSSIFNSDIKGLIFIGLLLLNCGITIGIGSIMPTSKNDCIRVSLTDDGSTISNLPLNINILSFTLAYLAYIIGITNAKAKDPTNQLVIKNVPTILVFALLIIAEFVNAVIIQNCADAGPMVISLILGGGLGALFSYAVDKSGIVQLQYFNGISNQQVCTRATNAKYKCTTVPVNI
jgi:hypothetical protein